MVALEDSTLFGTLSGDELARLRGMAQERSFAAGQEIFREGDAGDGLYVLQSGRVEISVLVRENTRHVFSQIAPGDIFGEMAVVEDQPRSASAVSREGSTAYFLPRREMLELLAQSPALALGLMREISGRLREFNHRYLREVLQAERLALVGRFSRSIIHDVKNPLNIIGLSAELTGMESVAPDIRRNAVKTIRYQVDHISDMIGEILDFTQGPQAELVLVPVDYGELLGEIARELHEELALKSVELEVQQPLPAAKVLVHPKRLRRVFHNLTHNATDAMPEGGKVFLRSRAEATQVVTEVEDTGPGIAPEIIGQLFEPFATHGKVHGTGLGLSICRRILEDHQGWITARNEPGRGAIFSFGLPLAETR